MKTIINNYRFSCCPLCDSSAIFMMGALKYAEELSLSTVSIRLTLVPELWRCSNCLSSFTQNSIPPAIAEELYAMGNGSKRWAYESFEKDKTAAVVDYFRNNASFREKKILDIGCNTGEFLDFLARLRNRTFGLEICKESCAILSEKGHTAFQSSADVSGQFDVVTAFDLFEHLYDIKGFLEFVKSIMTSSGLFVVLTGNPRCLSAMLASEKWWYANYPEHVIFPSEQFFREHMTGFSVVEILHAHASKVHASLSSGFLNRWKKFFGLYFSNQYKGIPALYPDHLFVVMKKK